MICHYCEKYPSDEWCESLPIVYRDEEGKSYCVFHAPQGKKGVSLYEFNEYVFDLITKAQKERRNCGLYGVVFEGDIHFQRFNKDNPLPSLSFHEVLFPGEVNFSNTYCAENVTFSDTVFQGEADFINTIFKKGLSLLLVKFQGEAIFIGTEFLGPNVFMGVEFSSTANFLNAKFHRWVHIPGCIFKDYARFELSNFSESVHFQRSHFKKQANFENCKFKGELVLEETKFDKEVFFKSAEFDNKVSILNTIFEEKADFSKVLFYQNSFIKGETFHDIGMLTNVSIRDKLVLDGVSLKKTSFLDSDLRKMDFYNCEWHQEKGWKLLYDEILAITTKTPSSSSQLIGKVEILYRQLKQKCKEENNEIEASNWHYREKEMQRKGSSTLFIKIFLNIYYAASGYGENPRLALLVLVLLILLSTFVLSICGLIPVNSASQLCDVEVINWPQNADFQQMTFVLSDVFKYVTFQKDYCLQPTSSMGQIFKIFIQIFIPIQGALLAFALKNKFRR